MLCPLVILVVQFGTIIICIVKQCYKAAFWKLILFSFVRKFFSKGNHFQKRKHWNTLSCMKFPWINLPLRNIWYCTTMVSNKSAHRSFSWGYEFCSGGFRCIYFVVVIIGRIQLSVNTASSNYELSKVTHVTPFHTYRFHSTGLCNYKPGERTYRRTTCCRYGLMVRK